jgi:hypothetical protein
VLHPNRMTLFRFLATQKSLSSVVPACVTYIASTTPQFTPQFPQQTATYRVEKHVARLTRRRHVHHARLVKRQQSRAQRAPELERDAGVPLWERACAFLLRDGGCVRGGLGDGGVRWDLDVHILCVCVCGCVFSEVCEWRLAGGPMCKCDWIWRCGGCAVVVGYLWCLYCRTSGDYLMRLEWRAKFTCC